MPAAAGALITEGRRILIAFIVACAFLMQGIDSALLTIAIPTIAQALKVDPLLLHLAITGYLISLAVFMPVSGLVCRPVRGGWCSAQPWRSSPSAHW